MKPQHVKTGFVLLSSQAAASVLNFIPSAFAIATLTDVDVATMAVIITGYTLALSAGRSLFGEAILVLSAEKGSDWARNAAGTIRSTLAVTSLLLLILASSLTSLFGSNLSSWTLTVAVSLAMTSHDTKRYELIACRRETNLLIRDGFLVTGITAALFAAWKLSDPSVDVYLTTWCVVALISSMDLLRSRRRFDVVAACDTIRTGRAFAFDPIANRVGILVVAIIAREVAGDASLADTEAQRLTMAAVNVAFLGAGPISLMGLPGRRTVVGDSARVSAVLAVVATAWWLVMTGVAQLGAETLPRPLEPWTHGVQWKVLVWYIGVAVPFGFRYRMRTALASRTILIAASAEATGGVLVVLVATAIGFVGTAQGIFALYFAMGAIAWVIPSVFHKRIETQDATLSLS